MINDVGDTKLCFCFSGSSNIFSPVSQGVNPKWQRRVVQIFAQKGRRRTRVYFGGREHPKSRIWCESARLNQHVDVKRRSQSHAALIFAKLRRGYFWRAEGSGGDFRLPRRSFSRVLAALFFQRVRDATTDPRPQLHQQLFSATFIFVCCYKQRWWHHARALFCFISCSRERTDSISETPTKSAAWWNYAVVSQLEREMSRALIMETRS